MKENIKKVLFFVLMPFLALIIGMSAIVFNNDNSVNVYADNIDINFFGSNVYLPLTPQVYRVSSDGTYIVSRKDNSDVRSYEDFITYLNYRTILISIPNVLDYNEFTYSPQSSFMINYFNSQTFFSQDYFHIYSGSTYQKYNSVVFPSYFAGSSIEYLFVSDYVFFTHSDDTTDNYGFNVVVSFSDNFSNIDFIGCRQFSEYILQDYSSSGGRIGFLITNHLRYFTSDGEYIDFAFRIYCNQASASVLLSDRTYYFSNALDLSANENYTLGYSSGYEEGSTTGYNSGYQAGVDYVNNNILPGVVANAEETGYQRGILDANDYSFYGLITSVVDAPINSFKSLFNFEILGVNILSFLTGLLTLGVVLFIIKLIAR